MTNTPPTNQAIENLLTVLDVVREHTPPGVAEWFADGVDAFMATNGSLDKCLGLAAANGKRAVQEYFIWKRNQFLQEAWNYCDGVTDDEKSKSLSIAVNAFLKKWPEFSKYHEPDEEWSGLRIALFRACKFGFPPRSAKQLKTIGRSPPKVASCDWWLYKRKA